MTPATSTSIRTRSNPAQLGGLVWTLVRTDFVTRYHGTVGGFVWALLKPLAMFLVLMGVFSFVFSNTPQYRLNLVIGIFVYEFFQEATKTGLLSLRAKGYLLTKARFPTWIVVATSVSNSVITLVVFFVVLLTFLVASSKPPSLGAVALVVSYQLLLLLIVLGFSLGASVCFMKFRDLNQVWDVISHAGFFVAPVIYPLSVLPERMHFFLYLWPPTPVIQFTRSVLVDGVIPSARAHTFLALEAAMALAAGSAIYRNWSRRVIEYL